LGWKAFVTKQRVVVPSFLSMTCCTFEVRKPVTLSLSKGRAERPLPAMVRQAHHDSPFYDGISLSVPLDFSTGNVIVKQMIAKVNLKFTMVILLKKGKAEAISLLKLQIVLTFNP